jgi:hypothetical protein
MLLGWAWERLNACDGMRIALPKECEPTARPARNGMGILRRFGGFYRFDTTASATWDGSAPRKASRSQGEAVLWQSRPRLLIATFDIEVSATMHA